MKEQEQLKPCPFCEAQPKKYLHGIGFSCPNFKVAQLAHFDTWDEAIKAWNTRQPESEGVNNDGRPQQELYDFLQNEVGHKIEIDDVDEIYHWILKRFGANQPVQVKCKSCGSTKPSCPECGTIHFNPVQVSEGWSESVTDITNNCDKPECSQKFFDGMMEVFDEDEPYFGWCNVEGCQNEGANGGNCWRGTGYWTVCSKHASEYRAGKPQPKMKQSAIEREKRRGDDGILAPESKNK